MIEMRNHVLTDIPYISKTLSSLGSKFALITDDTVGKLYGKTLSEALKKEGLEVYLFSFPQGEQYKTRQTKELIENEMFERGLGRDTCVIAMGGGVVTDLAGFLAATFCRGVSLVMIPTTLLGMVDASIGGKVGVNVPYGKNLVGAFYLPNKIWIDPSTLQTLHHLERKNGFVEMLKAGLIADADFFTYLHKNPDSILELEVIQKSFEIKLQIVEQDRKDKGIRTLLNFGHTVGHALEKATRYSLKHGEAVALGILCEAFISLKSGVLSEKPFQYIQKVFTPLVPSPKISIDQILTAMQWDKKSSQGKARFVMIEDIGSPCTFDGQYCAPVDKQILMESLEWMLHDLCCH